MSEPTMTEPTPTLPHRPAVHAPRRLPPGGTDGLPAPTAARHPADPPAARVRDALLAAAARLLGFGAVLGALTFACLGWSVR